MGSGTVVGLAGCTGNEGDATEEPGQQTEAETTPTGEDFSKYGGHGRVSGNRVMNNVNPYRIDVMDERAFLGMMYSTLTYLDYDIQPQPDLALEWSSSDDLRSWTFDLRDDATFHHDGSTVTAPDVKASLDTLYDPDVGAAGQGMLGTITEVEAPDDTTVIINTKDPTPDLPLFVSKKWGAVLPKDILESKPIDHFNRNEYGSGPYKLESFEQGSQAALSRFEDYHLEEDGDQLPYMDQITWFQLPEFSTEMNRFTEGDTDWVWQTAASQVARLEAMDGITPYSKPSGTNLWLVMRHDTEPFDDVRVRKAFSYAVNRERMLDNVLQGQGSIGQDSVISPLYRFYKDIDNRTRDVERAKQLLADAGYPDGFHLKEDFGITFFSASSPRERLNMAISIQQDLKDIGVTASLEQTTYDRYIGEVWRSAPLYAGFYGMRFSEDDWMNLVIHSDATWSDENMWRNEEADRLIEDARRTNDPEERQRLYGQVQQLMHDEVVYVVPVYLNMIGAKWNYVNNYETHPMPMKMRSERAWLGQEAPTRQ